MVDLFDIVKRLWKVATMRLLSSTMDVDRVVDRQFAIVEQTFVMMQTNEYHHLSSSSSLLLARLLCYRESNYYCFT